jgi:hypothetical protein
MVLPRMTRATLEHLPTFAICLREFGDTKNGLALIAFPKSLKYHSSANGHQNRAPLSWRALAYPLLEQLVGGIQQPLLHRGQSYLYSR